MPATKLALLFFLQLAIIISVSRCCGWAVQRWLRQPPVIGEMIAGVLLGPSLLGALTPETQGLLFPADSRKVLFVVAQFGIGLYMFIVGLGFHSDDFRAQAPKAAAVSISGIVVPFIVALFAVPGLMRIPDLFAVGVSRFDATLFSVPPLPSRLSRYWRGSSRTAA